MVSAGIAIALVRVGLSLAQVPIQPALLNPYLRQIYRGAYPQVDSVLENGQTRLEKGEEDEFSSARFFQYLAPPDESFMLSFDKWVAAEPDQPWGYLVRGHAYHYLAELHRAGRSYGSLSPSESADIQGLTDQAKNDLTHALSLRPGLIIALSDLLEVAQGSGNRSEAQHWLAEANKSFPNNYFARNRYLLQLTPRWGGSNREMEVYVASLSKENLPDGVKFALEAKLHDLEGRDARDDGNLELAQKDFVLALKVNAQADPVIRKNVTLAAASICEKSEFNAETWCRPD